jgi:hypothetical protein
MMVCPSSRSRNRRLRVLLPVSGEELLLEGPVSSRLPVLLLLREQALRPIKTKEADSIQLFEPRV